MPVSTSALSSAFRDVAVSARAWWRAVGQLLREQWIFAALLGLTWCGDLLIMLAGGRDELLAAPGVTLVAGMALVGRRHPVVCGALAALVLLGNTVLLAPEYAPTMSYGPLNPVLAWMFATENFAGMLLVLALFQVASMPRALLVTGLLSTTAVASVVLRGDGTAGAGTMLDPVWLGFLQLILATGTGLYSRASRTEGTDGAASALLRRQWPVIAALCVLMFLQMISLRSGFPAGVVVLLGCGVLAVLAVLAPARPVEAPILGAVALIGMAVLLRLIGQQPWGFLGPIPLTAVGAGMVLVAFAARFAERRMAVRAGGALVVAALIALFLIPGRLNYLEPGHAAGPLFMGGVLLVIAVGTGRYFRARDVERARSVRDAISRAQQAERIALARELHDIVAHQVTGIVVQAQAAQLVVEHNRPAATEALNRIAESGTEALTAMRRLVTSMREESDQPVGVAGAGEQATTDLESDLHEIVANLRTQEGAPELRLNTDLRDAVPQEVARSAQRVVQEALTNSGKHALDVTHVDVRVRTAGDELHVGVVDDGTTLRRRPAGGTGGYGLVGMRERVELLGGHFKAGPGERVGWRVEAALPLKARNEEREPE